MINLPVLVLNQTYEPLNICRVRRAMVLIYQEKAEMLENGYGTLHTIDRDLPVPSVIKLSRIIKRPYQLERKLTRMEIFRRDNYICQYCGKVTRNLTLDHVIPRFRNGQHTWENVVSACVPCNRIKAGRTPEEAGMKLRTKPTRPRPGGLFFVPSHYPHVRSEWEKYLPQGKAN
ncbi:MAG: HNH endonuclease [Dehalococcoidales bacterium]|nr:MAG: HNH endonuclease [Dehalococcoidales bacterium]